MAKEDPAPLAIVGRFGLVLAYVCFLVAVVMLSAAIYLLPLDFKTKIFLAAGGLLLIPMVVMLAIATHLVSRAQTQRPSAEKSRRKAAPPVSPGGADSSQRPR